MKQPHTPSWLLSTFNCNCFFFFFCLFIIRTIHTAAEYVYTMSDSWLFTETVFAKRFNNTKWMKHIQICAHDAYASNSNISEKCSTRFNRQGEKKQMKNISQQILVEFLCSSMFILVLLLLRGGIFSAFHFLEIRCISNYLVYKNNIKQFSRFLCCFFRLRIPTSVCKCIST